MSMDALSQNYAPRHSEPGHDTDRRIFDPELHRQPPPSSEIRLGPESTAQHIMTPAEQPYEIVEHPIHYNLHPAGIECIDVIEAFPCNIALVIKHLWRAGLKPGMTLLDDLRKARWYLDREIARQERTQEQRL